MYKSVEEIVAEREQKSLEIREKRKKQVKRYYIAAAVVVIFAVCAVCMKVPVHKGAALTSGAKTKINVEMDAEPYIEPQVDLVMVGDVLLHDAVQSSGALSDGTYNYDHLFANVTADIQAADFAIVNQEVILGGKELGLSGYPKFNGPYEAGDALVKAGFDVVLHATNHAMDRGREALLNCLNYWRESHTETAVLGIHDSVESANHIYIYEKDGIKIAVLNYTYGLNGMQLPSDMPFAVSMLDETKVRADLAKAKEMSDFIVVCPQWGNDYSHQKSADQEQWTNIFLENGVDLVLGTHTHFIQPVEMRTGENGNQMLVYYSLGNFVSATSESGSGIADRVVGAMAEVTIARKENGEVYIKDYGVEPLVTHMASGVQQITTYKLADYTEELASGNEILRKDASFSLAFCQNLCENVFGELY